MEPTRQLPAIRLTQIAEIAAQLFSEQTGQDVQAIKTHFGAAYSEAKTIALILVLRPVAERRLSSYVQ